MIQEATPKAPMAAARKKLLDAAMSMIRTRGYQATTIDELCAAAGVAKGSFFHHFKDKEALGVALAAYSSERSGAFFAAAPYHRHADPLDRVLGYIDFRKSLLTGDVSKFSCLFGTIVQEVYSTNPEICAAWDASITSHAATVEVDIAEAVARRGIRDGWTPESLALHTQAVLQGAIILAKAKGNAADAVASVEHLRRYIEFLFQPKETFQEGTSERVQKPEGKREGIRE